MIKLWSDAVDDAILIGAYGFLGAVSLTIGVAALYFMS